MRFQKSIRGRLVLWLGFLLACILVGFGVTAWQLHRVSRLQQIDEDLERRVDAVSRQFTGPPPRPIGAPRREPGREGPDNLFVWPSRPEGRPSRDRPEDMDRFKERIIASRVGEVIEEMNTGPSYLAIWTSRGTLVAETTNAPANMAFPELSRPDNAFHARDHGTFREVFRFTEMGECVLIGRDIAPDLGAMRGFAGWLFVAGLGVLLLGVGGGWMFLSRALRPVAAISSAAGRIADGDLSRRIEIAEPDSELGHLTADLNATFARLETAFQRQRQFTSDASHELRTPLAIMISEAQTTLARERDADEYRETVVNCLDAAQQMRRLTESLLQLARDDAGQLTVVRESLDLSGIVQGEVARLQTLAGQKQISFDLCCSSAPVLGDSAAIKQLVVNLLTNAIHYNVNGGRVSVTTGRDERFSMVEVKDTGIGISTEDLPHIFERFYRADKSRSRAEGHAGLGMAIAKNIVDAHGGEIYVTSEKGVGTKFRVSFAVHDERSA